VSGGVDQEWTVDSGPAYVITDPGSVGWIGNTAVSQWISNAPDTEGGGGPFTYSTTFTATGGSNEIEGMMAADDQGSIYLNGTLVFSGASTFTSPWSYFENFTITSNFVVGSNALTVIVPNNIETSVDGPTGLQIAFVPEPATWAMMLLGFAGLGFAGFRTVKAKTGIA
jgi:PEP-CTERM motif